MLVRAIGISMGNPDARSEIITLYTKLVSLINIMNYGVKSIWKLLQIETNI